MAGDDQERFEDYLELERYIERLQSGQVAHPPAELTPEQARIYQMAAFFRAATPENVEPQPEFVEHLKQQLLELNTEEIPAPASNLHPDEKNARPVGVSRDDDRKKVHWRPVRFVSRRRLLMGGAIAAASLVVGGGVEHVIEQQSAAKKADQTLSIPPYPATRLEIESGIPITWHFVVRLADLGQSAVRFITPTLTGYVLRNPQGSKNSADPNASITALSAACTHMGCIVQWKDADRSFHCPCHSAVFTETGIHQNLNYRYGLPPLPLLQTKVEDGNVYVMVPQAH
ncbi:QcrA and Rieske domain-containing protein [Dictyobacter aurantiacus]|uniref:(2Fe-2S) ferredoxin n=1 Tax=Dictyobacter aurantiacus TaxID=1936993 RepID=A0A401ZSQ4_9CHLR|nr:Rieske 2Fe-2S domain-containing protein [Dictyobacter aurantiacus]GCE09893.1 (2Fe-2S) ferredoxin [Dictyobacter aurantiacus]